MKDKIGTHGRVFTGKVIADRMHKTVTVEWERRKYVPKYERYAKRRTRVKAHNPEHINAKAGQTVKIMETRKLSKTKNFIVIEIVDETVEKQPEKKAKKAPKKEAPKEESESKDDSELPARSTVEGMTKDEIKEYAKKEFNVELSTSDLKDEMIDQLFKEAGQ